MAAYRRAIEAFRSFSSHGPSFRESASRIRANGATIISPDPAKSSTSSVSQRFGLGLLGSRCQSGVVNSRRVVVPNSAPFAGGGGGGGFKRFYYVDNRRVQHFKPRGFRRWIQNPRNVVTVVLVGSGVVITVYFGNLETVPYTKRKHFVLLSSAMEKRMAETQFQELKGSFKDKILPAIHPDSIRIRVIAKDIIEALQRGVRNEQMWSDVSYSSAEVDKGSEGGGGGEMHKMLSEDEGMVEPNWGGKGEVLDDKWMEQTRKTGRKAEISHLDGMNWEVIVVNQPVVNAFCLPGGKIVVFTGLLKHFNSDAEIATVVGHEIAHAVARHTAEKITKNVWFTILQIVLLQFITPDIAQTMSNLFLSLPFDRKMEIEADYIGLLLMASAGYDPRIAPTVYEKLGKISGESALRNYLSTHPSGKKRSSLLAQAHVMDEALTIYRETLSGRGIEGFFLDCNEIRTQLVVLCDKIS
ncbi:Mitochondrial metalloendopeptidase OMA1 [Linum grandiflorum]